MLPNINESLRYTTTIPSTGATVAFRPFTAAEEKLLLVAKEAPTLGGIITALETLLKKCLLDFDATERLTMFDVEWLFVQLRAKSVGEVDQFNVPCKMCDHSQLVEFNYETDVRLVIPGNKVSNLVTLNGDYSLEMQMPTVGSMKALDTNAGEEDTSWQMLESCVVGLNGPDKYYRFSEETADSRRTFMKSLTAPQLGAIKAYLESFPKVQAEMTTCCEKCGHTSSLEVEGLANFFG